MFTEILISSLIIGGIGWILSPWGDMRDNVTECTCSEAPTTYCHGCGH